MFSCYKFSLKQSNGKRDQMRIARVRQIAQCKNRIFSRQSNRRDERENNNCILLFRNKAEQYYRKGIIALVKHNATRQSSAVKRVDGRYHDAIDRDSKKLRYGQEGKTANGVVGQKGRRWRTMMVYVVDGRRALHNRAVRFCPTSGRHSLCG